MHPLIITLNPAAANPTYFAAAGTGGLPWTLSNNKTPDGLAHQVSIRNNSATDHSGKTVTITGVLYDGSGVAAFTALPGPNATITISEYFKELVSIVPSASIGSDTMSIGYASKISTPPYVLGYGRNTYIGVGLVGTANYTIQYTGDNPLIDNVNSLGRDYIWISDNTSDIVNATTSAADTLTSNPMAIRLVTSSYSAGATLVLTIKAGSNDSQ